MRILVPVFSAITMALCFSRCQTNKCSCLIEGADSSVNLATPDKYKLSERPAYLSMAVLKKYPRSRFLELTYYLSGDSVYLVYIAKDSKIVFVNLLDSNKTHVSNFPDRSNLDNYALIFTTKDTLHLLYTGTKIYQQFAINNNQSVVLVKEVDLGPLFKDKNSFIKHNDYGRLFDYRYPYLLIPYGKQNGNDFIDKQSHLLVNINNLASRHILDFPSCYASCYTNTRENPTAVFSGGSIYGLFSLCGEFRRYDTADGSERSIKIPFSAPFVEYDKKQIGNLAYSRKYELLYEKNVDIIPLADQSVVIVKRLKKDSFDKKNVYRYYVYDKNDQLRAMDLFPTSISGLFWHYKNGFMTVNDSLSKFYYYEKN